MSRGALILVLTGCLVSSSCVSGPPAPGSRSIGPKPTTTGIGTAPTAGGDAGAAPDGASASALASETPAPRPPGRGRGSCDRRHGCPSRPRLGRAGAAHSRAQHGGGAAAARLAPTRVERVRPHLPAGTELHGVSLLASADTARGRSTRSWSASGRRAEWWPRSSSSTPATASSRSSPRARAGGPDALRVGSLLVPLNDRALLGGAGPGGGGPRHRGRRAAPGQDGGPGSTPGRRR